MINENSAEQAAVDVSVESFTQRWQASAAAETANSQSFITELCDLLGVERPRPQGHEEADYVFERRVANVRTGTTNFIDLYRRGCFVWENKQGSDEPVGKTTLAGERTRLKAGTARRGTDATIVPFVRSLVGVLLKVLVLVSAAGMFGVETTSFVAILGAAGFAVGLALQGSLGHLASGVLLLTFRPYKVGDVVEVAGKTGAVQEIQIFNTVLKTPDNHRVVVPNGTVTSGVITNLSGQGTRGVTCTFGIGYDDDIDRARAIILRVAAECPHTLDEPAPAVVVTEHGDSAVTLHVRPFVASADWWAAFTYMMEHVKKAFDAEGISIPYPQRDVHVYRAEEAMAAMPVSEPV